jgi:hypothetical protein
VISLEDVEELDKIHDQLDISVLDSYGWDKSVGDEEIIDNLLQLNNSRPGKELKGEEPEEE